MDEDKHIDAFEKVRKIAETILPAYMLAVAVQSMEQNENLKLRDDVTHGLNAAQHAAVRDLPRAMALLVGQRVEKDGYVLMQNANKGAASLRDLVIGLAKFTLKLVDEGLFQDVQNGAVLASLAIMTDLEEGGDTWGNVPDSDKCMASVLTQARLLGYYQDVIQDADFTVH